MLQNKYNNSGKVNVDKVMAGIEENAGGTVKTSQKKDGVVHKTVYIPPNEKVSQYRLSCDIHPDGTVDKVHTVKTDAKTGVVTKTTYGNK